MTLNKCGHGQTLEIYKYNGKTYLLVSSKENKISDSTYWSVQVARVEYQANKTYNYTSLHTRRYGYEEIVQKNRSYTSINNGNWFDSGSGC